MGDEFRREIAAASLPSTRVTNVIKSDCGIALVKKGRKAKVVSGPQTVWGKHHSFSTAPTRPRRDVCSSSLQAANWDDRTAMWTKRGCGRSGKDCGLCGLRSGLM